MNMTLKLDGRNERVHSAYRVSVATVRWDRSNPRRVPEFITAF